MQHRAGTLALLTSGEQAAISTATQVAARHQVAQSSLQLAASDVILGRSQSRTGQPWQFTAGQRPFNAVQVRGRRTSDSPSGPVTLLLGPILGTNFFEPTQIAIASQVDQEFALVIESSGLMHAPSRWADVGRSLDKFGQALMQTTNRSSMCLIECKNRPSLRMPLTDNNLSLNATLNLIAQEYDEIKLSQGRDLGGGLLLASDTLNAQPASPFALKRILFIGNGNENRGISPSEAARIAASRGQIIYSITVGHNADRDGSLTEAATITGGEALHVDDDIDLLPLMQRFVRNVGILTIQ